MKYIFANWKMYLGVRESVALAKAIVALGKKKRFPRARVGLFPTALAFTDVAAVCAGSRVAVGGQNCAWTPAGAYTGAISADMFRRAGAAYMIVGHSERRHIFGEGDSDVRKKIEACLDARIVPIVCIGETKEEKENGKREYRLKKQLMSAFQGLSLKDGQAMVAYEPVWAIGTGDACAPADADDVHGWIRTELAAYTDAAIPVLYGGSVDAKNAHMYTELETVDGLLVGTAATKKESLAAILTSVSV